MNPLIEFWTELVNCPRHVGAIFPSGRRLSASIARLVSSEPASYLIEIGAGTGALTYELSMLRSKLLGFIVVEKSERMAKILRYRFPYIEVRVGCASTIYSEDVGHSAPLTIVSSLPFRSLPREDVSKIKDAIVTMHRRLPRLRFIQYTYFGGPPFASPSPVLHWEKRQTVFANFPPATIWELSSR